MKSEFLNGKIYTKYTPSQFSSVTGVHNDTRLWSAGTRANFLSWHNTMLMGDREDLAAVKRTKGSIEMSEMEPLIPKESFSPYDVTAEYGRVGESAGWPLPRDFIAPSDDLPPIPDIPHKEFADAEAKEIADYETSSTYSDASRGNVGSEMKYRAFSEVSSESMMSGTTGTMGSPTTFAERGDIIKSGMRGSITPYDPMNTAIGYSSSAGV